MLLRLFYLRVHDPVCPPSLALLEESVCLFFSVLPILCIIHIFLLLLLVVTSG